MLGFVPDHCIYSARWTSQPHMLVIAWIDGVTKQCIVRSCSGEMVQSSHRMQWLCSLLHQRVKLAECSAGQFLQ